MYVNIDSSCYPLNPMYTFGYMHSAEKMVSVCLCIVSQARPLPQEREGSGELRIQAISLNFL